MYISHATKIPHLDLGGAKMSVREYLRDRHVPFIAMLHRPAVSAARLAQSMHVTGSRVAKSVVFRAGGGYVLAVVPATHRVEVARLSDVLGIDDLALATEDEVAAIFADCERGAIPPFGRLYGLPTILDAELAGLREIVTGGNTRHEGIRLRGRDYLALENPLVARVGQRINPPRRKLQYRAG
jgi:Ala-tRNA(Pro) deacylase